MVKEEAAPETHWYAIYTRSRTEKKVYTELIKRNIHVFLPLHKTVRQWSDRKKTVEVPLFNSYLFVCINEKEYLTALQVEGVVRYVTFEGKAVSIPPQQIEAIKAYIDEGTPAYEESLINLEAGVNIEITRGPMMGLNGILLNFHGKHRVKVEIDCVGQSLIIDVPRTSLRRV
ncbi:MAG: UpxY family transcription antiterminator [Bacteroidetes bacterium]|nr:UpxY family transcription antiterminator [Bacteroidota bacterium]